MTATILIIICIHSRCIIERQLLEGLLPAPNQLAHCVGSKRRENKVNKSSSQARELPTRSLYHLDRAVLLTKRLLPSTRSQRKVDEVR